MKTEINQPTQEQEVRVSTPENSWFDGKNWIPVSEMSDTHLRRAKLFCQKKEEYHFFQCSKFSEKIELLEIEAQKRNIVLKDRRSKFRKNTKILKSAV